MDHPALATAQSSTDLAQRLRIGQLAKQHRDEVIPTPESLRAVFGSGSLYGRFKFSA
jgi:hypothetical protein